MKILVVSGNHPGLADMLRILDDAGYRASGASTFEEATRLLSCSSPDLVIADQRLGAFNGLHIILRARAVNPDVSAIVTTPVKNRGLEADARRLNVECMTKPQNPADWLEPIWRTLNSDRAGECSTVHCEAIPAIGRA